MLEVRKNEIALRKLSDDIARLRTSEGTLVTLRLQPEKHLTGLSRHHWEEPSSARVAAKFYQNNVSQHLQTT